MPQPDENLNVGTNQRVGVFREELNKLLKENAPLEEIKNYYQHQKPANFDINDHGKNHNVHDTILMDCLNAGVNLETFKYFEAQGAEISKSISAKDEKIEAQKIPFSIKDSVLQFSTQEIQQFKDEGEKSNPAVSDRYKNSSKILNHINENTNTDQKNEMGFLQMSMYFLDDKLVDNLLKDKEIDVNNKNCHRSTSPIKMAVMSNIREHQFDKLIHNSKVAINPDDGILQQAAMFRDKDAVESLLKIIPPHKKKDAIFNTLLKLGTVNDMETYELLAESSPEAVKRILVLDKDIKGGMESNHEAYVERLHNNDIITGDPKSGNAWKYLVDANIKHTANQAVEATLRGDDKKLEQIMHHTENLDMVVSKTLQRLSEMPDVDRLENYGKNVDLLVKFSPTGATDYLNRVNTNDNSKAKKSSLPDHVQQSYVKNEKNTEKVLDNLTPLIENFAENIASRGKVSELQVNQYHEKVLNNLLESGKITKNHRNDILNSKNFNQSITDTTVALNNNIPNVSVAEKITYQTGKFLKNFGITKNLGEKLTKNLSTKKQKAMVSFENILASSLQVEKAFKVLDTPDKKNPLDKIHTTVKTKLESKRNGHRDR